MDSERVSYSVCNSWCSSLIFHLTLCRTISIISLLDCAFFFYQNYPCRLTHAEIESELPCDEALFRSPHPFQDPKFRFSREITIYQAFQHMFDLPTQDGSGASPPSSKIDLTVLDMFIVIHGARYSSNFSIAGDTNCPSRSTVRFYQYAYDACGATQTPSACHPSCPK
jgi:hypothetical protein